MRIGTIIESVYIRVKGGKLDSADVNIKRIDIRAYLPAAINFALRKQYYLDKQQEEETSLPNSFIATYENVEIKLNEDRGLRYIDLPARVVPFPKDMGINVVAPMKGNDDFFRMDGPYQDSHYDGYISKTRYFLEGSRIYFKNLSGAACKVLVRMMGSIDEFDDDAEAPIPAGLEPEVIQITYEFLTGQRMMPQDNTNNHSDTKQR